MAYFPFTGWKDSFFGNLHRQGAIQWGFTRTRKSWRNAGATSSRENCDVKKTGVNDRLDASLLISRTAVPKKTQCHR